MHLSLLQFNFLKNISHSCRVFCVKFSCDGTYVISASDDTNLRVWKAKASEQLGIQLPRERRRHEYYDALIKASHKNLPCVKRILRNRHLPKPLYKSVILKRTMLASHRKKDKRRKAHSAPGSMKTEPMRRRRIVKSIMC
ncbi:hypothetical protein IFM89_004454 [Coptis chinensis]|uniref:Sof1-like protein domain-containing protein n=1 Tax=Coptis chinensis TaxID=261450 RepID=A0A835GXC6_9MAGN|nr:hypothetical protein IFM89_004454 [Coptis chinensis]